MSVLNTFSSARLHSEVEAMKFVQHDDVMYADDEHVTNDACLDCSVTERDDEVAASQYLSAQGHSS
jgi:hypothetical protein